jgi:hypothetical protein
MCSRRTYGEPNGERKRTVFCIYGSRYYEGVRLANARRMPEGIPFPCGVMARDVLPCTASDTRGLRMQDECRSERSERRSYGVSSNAFTMCAICYLKIIFSDSSYDNEETSSTEYPDHILLTH